MTDTTRRQFLRTAMIGGALAALPLTTRAQGTTHTVRIQGHAFVPARLEIAAGDTVVWFNADGAPHTATANDRRWDTGRLRRGQQAALRFDRAGSHGYFCAIHPRMKGSVTVR